MRWTSVSLIVKSTNFGVVITKTCHFWVEYVKYYKYGQAYDCSEDCVIFVTSYLASIASYKIYLFLHCHGQLMLAFCLLCQACEEVQNVYSERL